MISISDSSNGSLHLEGNVTHDPEGKKQNRFSFIQNVTPILLREEELDSIDNSKWRSSLDNPLFREPIDHLEKPDISEGELLQSRETPKNTCWQYDETKQTCNLQKSDSFSSNKYGYSKRNSNRFSDADLSCDSDGGISDEVSPPSHVSESCVKQLDTVGKINVREMASFLEKTDSFIRMLEPATERSRIPSSQRLINNRRSWSSECSSEQFSLLNRPLTSRENESSLQRMEQLIEIQKENAHLKERLLRLQGKLEKSERENMKLREELKNYRQMNPTEEEGLLSFSLFEYSQALLTKILKCVGIPNEAIERISIQIELEYQRHSTKNYLLTALSYCFDYLMRSFLEEPHEFSTSLSDYSTSSTILLPHYSESFKDFVDTLSQHCHQSIYNEIKRFVIEQWNVIYNNCSSRNGKTLPEIIRDFCTAMEDTIAATIKETLDIKEGLEQLLMNMLGGGLVNQMLNNIQKKETILNKHIRILQFIEPEHLDVKEKFVNHPHFSTAVSHLQSIVHCRSPKHMLKCLGDAVKTLFSILGSEHSSADDFLPLFIFCTLRSNTYFLLTVSDYINLYRNPKDLLMGDGYMLVNLMSSLQFILNMDANYLSMNPIDYRRLYAAAEDAIRDEENKRFSIFYSCLLQTTKGKPAST